MQRETSARLSKRASIRSVGKVGARAAGRGGVSRHHVERLVLGAFALTAISLLAGPGAVAAPKGGNVTHGEATINQSGDKTTVRQSSQEAIIEYRDFDIGSGETVKFVQPGAKARVLNRVTGASSSNIAGRLTANGQVYLLNPNGVYFADGAQIDVGGLYAAAGNMSNSDFLEGTDRFTNLQGEVINYGTIEGGSVHLMGQRVANYGDIRANGGVLTMLAGDKVMLREVSGRVSVEIDGKKLLGDKPRSAQSDIQLASDAGVRNEGTVDAGGGQATLGAGDMYSLAVRNSGSVESAGGTVEVAAQDGAVHNTGKVSASVEAGQAGEVTVQGPAIANEGTIAADAATGEAGQTRVLAQDRLVLTDGSRVSAAGLDTADGGRAIVNTFGGHSFMLEGAVLDASGGANAGAGGFAEFSGQSMTLNGDVRLAGSPSGDFLLDPVNIDIVSGNNGTGNADDDFGDNGTPNELLSGEGPNDATVSVGKLESFSSDTTITLQASQDIQVLAPVNFDPTKLNSLTLEAGNDVRVNADITGALELNITADLDNNNQGQIELAGPINLNTTGDQIYNGKVELSNPVTFEAGDSTAPSVAVFRGRLMKHNPRPERNTDRVDVTIDGDAVFLSFVGPDPNEINTKSNRQTMPAGRPDSLTVNGDTILALSGNELTDFSLQELALSRSLKDEELGRVWTKGTQDYNGDVILANDANLVAGDSVRIEGGVKNIAPGSPNFLWVEPTFNSAGDAVTSIDIDVGDVGVGDIEFGNVPPQPSSPVGALALENNGGLTTIGGDKPGGSASSILAVNDVFLNSDPGNRLADPEDGAPLPGLARIAAPNGDLSVESITGDIWTGRKQPLSVVGDVELTAPGQEIFVSDISALGDVDVTADTLNLFVDPGVNYVIGGQPNLNQVSDVGARDFDGQPFDTVDVLVSSVDPLVQQGLSPLQLVALNTQQNVALTEGDFFNAIDEVLNLEPETPSFDPAPIGLAEAQGDLTPGELPFDPGNNTALILTPQQRQAMADLGLEVQDFGSQQLASNNLVDDTGGEARILAAAGGEDSQTNPARVSVYRVVREPALRALQRYQTTFAETDTAQIQKIFNELWSAYRQASGDGASGEQWAKYLAQVDGKALTYLREMRGLVRDLEQAGVNRTERTRLLRILRDRYKPETMTNAQFQAAVNAVAPAPYNPQPPQTASAAG